MFRKYYKDVMNDIKPDEAFVLSVIENAKKRKPPAYACYTRYAAAIAAAVVIVSGTVLSMPLWQRVTENTDGIIIEETITDKTADTAAPASTAPTSAPVQTALPQSAKSVHSSESKPNPTQIPSQNKNNSNRALGEGVQSLPQTTGESAAESVSETESQTVAEDKGAESPAMPVPEPEAVAEDYIAANAEIAADSENELYYTKAFGASGSAASRSDETYAPAIPYVNAPSGYYAVYASGDYYEFENDSGDTVTVNLYWVGGNDTSAVYANDGGVYTAEKISDGYNITVSGTDKSAVDEVINNL